MVLLSIRGSDLSPGGHRMIRSGDEMVLRIGRGGQWGGVVATKSASVGRAGLYPLWQAFTKIMTAGVLWVLGALASWLRVAFALRAGLDMAFRT